jgi:hypothetical protein
MIGAEQPREHLALKIRCLIGTAGQIFWPYHLLLAISFLPAIGSDARLGCVGSCFMRSFFNSVEPMGNECRLHMACSSVNIQASERLLEFSQPREEWPRTIAGLQERTGFPQPCHIRGL